MTIVHWTEDVGILAQDGTLVLYGALVVNGVNPRLGTCEVLAVAGLIAKAPHDDARVVVVGNDVMLIALHDGFAEHWRTRQCLLLIAEAVTLLIGLSAKVYTILVAEVVPLGIVGIVACTYGIDIELLHATYVLYHALTTHHIASVGVHLVAVGTLDEYRLTVDEQLGTLDLHTSETYFLHHILSSTPDGERI